MSHALASGPSRARRSRVSWSSTNAFIGYITRARIAAKITAGEPWETDIAVLRKDGSAIVVHAAPVASQRRQTYAYTDGLPLHVPVEAVSVCPT